MEKRIYPEPIESVVSPEPYTRQSFTDAEKAVEALKQLYDRNTEFLRDSLRGARATAATSQALPRLLSRSRRHDDVATPRSTSRLSYGHMPTPGHLFDDDHPAGRCSGATCSSRSQLIMRNHGVPVTVGGIDRRRSRCISPSSKAPMSRARSPTGSTGRCATCSTCPISTAPTTTSSTAPSRPRPAKPRPLAPFTAQRIDYSLHRLPHYTATSAAAFPELRAVHQLPVLHRRVLRLRARR